MFAHGGEQDFPETANDKYGRVNRQEVNRAEQHFAQHARFRRHIDTQSVGKGVMPVVGDALLQQIWRQRAECLRTDVVHTVKHGGKQSQPHQNHHAFGVERVADVCRFARYRTGCIENRRRSFIEGIPFFMLAARQEVRFDFFQKMF